MGAVVICDVTSSRKSDSQSVLDWATQSGHRWLKCVHNLPIYPRYAGHLLQSLTLITP